MKEKELIPVLHLKLSGRGLVIQYIIVVLLAAQLTTVRYINRQLIKMGPLLLHWLLDNPRLPTRGHVNLRMLPLSIVVCFCEYFETLQMNEYNNMNK